MSNPLCFSGICCYKKSVGCLAGPFIKIFFICFLLSISKRLPQVCLRLCLAHYAHLLFFSFIFSSLLPHGDVFFLVPDPFWSHLNSVLDKTEVISAELGIVRSSFPASLLSHLVDLVVPSQDCFVLGKVCPKAPLPGLFQQGLCWFGKQKCGVELCVYWKKGVCGSREAVEENAEGW